MTEVCLASLAATNQVRFVSQTLTRSKNACAWVLKNQKYISWLGNHESSLLWITAKAGCGKTTMAAHISQLLSSNPSLEAQISQKVHTTCVVLFFFFRKSNQATEKTAPSARRTLVSQLAQQVPNV